MSFICSLCGQRIFSKVHSTCSTHVLFYLGRVKVNLGAFDLVGVDKKVFFDPPPRFCYHRTPYQPPPQKKKKNLKTIPSFKSVSNYYKHFMFFFFLSGPSSGKF